MAVGWWAKSSMTLMPFDFAAEFLAAGDAFEVFEAGADFVRR